MNSIRPPGTNQVAMAATAATGSATEHKVSVTTTVSKPPSGRSASSTATPRTSKGTASVWARQARRWRMAASGSRARTDDTWSGR